MGIMKESPAYVKTECLLIEGKYYPAKIWWCSKCKVKLESIENACNVYKCPKCGNIVHAYL